MPFASFSAAFSAWAPRQAIPLLEALNRALSQRAVQAVDRAWRGAQALKAALKDANGIGSGPACVAGAAR